MLKSTAYFCFNAISSVFLVGLQKYPAANKHGALPSGKDRINEGSITFILI